MNRHPGGEEHTRHLLELAKLPPSARVIDLGAGDGGSLRLLHELGYAAVGIDLEPRDGTVQRGDLLHTAYPDGSFDAVLSQCAFTLSGDVPGAFRESFRLLKPGGTLLFSDICMSDPEETAREAGFLTEFREDLTEAWREYYLEALWNGTAEYCAGRGKCRYVMLICRKEETNGSV